MLQSEEGKKARRKEGGIIEGGRRGRDYTPISDESRVN